MPASQLYFVSGKGGVGKTIIAAALAKHAAADGKRVLIVEPAPCGGVAPLFGKRRLSPKPTALAPGLDGVQIEPRVLVEEYFKRLLPVPILSRLLFESRTFNALTAAAPGG